MGNLAFTSIVPYLKLNLSFVEIFPVTTGGTMLLSVENVLLQYLIDDVVQLKIFFPIKHLRPGTSIQFFLRGGDQNSMREI